MHGIHKSLERRLEALEHRLGTIPEPETPEDQERRLVLVKAALDGHDLDDLDGGERVLFSKIVRYAPILHELVSEGVLEPYLDEA